MADRLTQVIRDHRQAAFARRWPRIEQFCSKHRVLIRRVEHGFQFRYNEYAVTWSPSTNSVSIQYCITGSDKTLPFRRNGQQNKPRILVALEEVVSLGTA